MTLDRIIILLLLGLSLLGLTTFSANANDEMDFFEEFSEEFENKVDIEIDSLNFTRPDSGTGKAGTFKFKKFQIQNPNFSIFVGNEDSIFDSNVFIKGSFIGIKGPLTRIAYNLDEVNAKYLNSFKFANIEKTRLLMDKEGISLSGLYYQIRKPESMLTLENFIWDCDRNEKYLTNDSIGFLSGCLNAAEVRSLDDNELINVNFTFFGKEENIEDKVEFSSKIKNVNFEDSRVTGQTEVSNITFGNGVHLVSSEMKADCSKPSDLIDINSDTLLIPCLNDFKMDSELFGIYFKDDATQSYNFENPKLTITDKKISIANKMFKYDSPTAKIKIQNVKMSADKIIGFDELNFKSYLESLINSNTFTATEGTEFAKLDFSLIEPEAEADETKVVHIQSFIKQFKTEPSKIVVDSAKTTISMDEDYDFHMNEVHVECDKEEKIVFLDGEKVLADCKHSGRYTMRDILIDNKKDVKKPKYYLKPEYLKVKDGYLSVLAPGFQLVDEKENITLLNTSLKCRKNYDKDLFNILDVLDECFKDSKAYISRIVSEKNKKRDRTENIYQLYEKMLRGKVANPINLIDTKDAFVRDVKIAMKNNWIKIDLDIKFWKADLKVKAEGRITLDRDEEIVTIDIKQTKLPLSKSKKVLMYFLRKNLANDTITFEDGLIKIKL